MSADSPQPASPPGVPARPRRSPSAEPERSRESPTAPDEGQPTAVVRRVVVEHVRSEIDGGRFPIKRTVGDVVEVRADIFADGHDVIAAVLRDRTATYNAEHAEHPEQDSQTISASSAGSALN